MAKRLSVACYFRRFTGPLVALSLMIFVEWGAYMEFLDSLGPSARSLYLCVVVPCVALEVVSMYKAVFAHPGHPPACRSSESVRSTLQSMVLEHICSLPSQGSVMVDLEKLLPGVRECEQCQYWKVLTTHHCSTCRTCVEGMDHHCSFLGQCLGEDNFKFFLLYIFYGCILATVSVACAFNHMARVGSSGMCPLQHTIWVVGLLSLILLVPFFMKLLRHLLNGTTSVVFVFPCQEQLPTPKKRPAKETLRRVIGREHPLWWLLPTDPQTATKEETEAEWDAELRAAVEKLVLQLLSSEEAGSGQKDQQRHIHEHLVDTFR